MSKVKIIYALWNRRNLFDGDIKNLLVDLDFALDSILTPYVHHDLMKLIGNMADRNEYTHVVVYASGTLLHKSYQLDVSWHQHCEGNWLVSGHILLRPKHQYPHLHEQAFAVNLGLWKELGRPDFGYDERGDKNLPAFQRSAENIHDDYTPLWIKAADGDMSTTRRKFGWNIIAASIANGYTVANLPNKIRQEKTYIYPDDDGQTLAEAVNLLRSDVNATVHTFENSTQQFFIEYLRNKLTTRHSPIFLFNTGLLYYDMVLDNDKIDTIWTTASGFKSFVEWQMNGAPAACEINTFDINKKSLSIWEHIHKNWNGNNFYDFILSHDEHCEREELYCWGNKEAKESIKESSDRQENELLLYFGTKENLIKQWKAFQRLKHRYHHIDLVIDHDRVLENLGNDKTNFMWINNIFYFRQNMLYYGLSYLNQSLCNLVDAINIKAPKTYMIGQCSTCYFGHQVKYISAHIREANDHLHQWDMNNKAESLR
jgi:hypothetical protein